MKNAIVLFVHQDSSQINLFLQQLLHGTDMDIYIHINKRFNRIRSELILNERILIVDDNIEITWGSDELLQAIILMSQKILKLGKEYGHILFSTGQDMLIKEGLDEFLSQHREEVFFEGYKDDKRRRAFLLHNWPSKYRQLIDYKFNPTKILRRLRLELFSRGLPFDEKKVGYDTKSIVFYRNWFWGAIPSVVLKYVILFLKENPGFWEIYRDALVPEEGFMTTIIMQSPYKDWLKFDSNGRSSSLTAILARSNGHPQNITFDDIPELDASPFFFARKFNKNVDEKVVTYYFKKICK